MFTFNSSYTSRSCIAAPLQWKKVHLKVLRDESENLHPKFRRSTYDDGFYHESLSKQGMQCTIEAISAVCFLLLRLDYPQRWALWRIHKIDVEASARNRSVPALAVSRSLCCRTSFFSCQPTCSTFNRTEPHATATVGSAPLRSLELSNSPWVKLCDGCLICSNMQCADILPLRISLCINHRS